MPNGLLPATSSAGTIRPMSGPAMYQGSGCMVARSHTKSEEQEILPFRRSLRGALGLLFGVLWFARPVGGDLPCLGAGHPDRHDLGACRACLVPHLVRRLHVAGHPRLQDLALSVDDVLELAGNHVEHLR